MTADPADIRIGISACLLGEEVRYDGGHKRDRFITDTLGRFVRYLTVCPELELGLGVPREPIRLERGREGLRLVGTRSRREHTAAMLAYARQRLAELEAAELSGFILKKGSPSCGMERVRVHTESGGAERNGRGLFAEALIERLPLLPVEEEGRLGDPALRENFFERVFAYRRLRGLFDARPCMGELVRFHSREKLLLMAHDAGSYRELGRLVAGRKGRPGAGLAREYQTLFMRGLTRIATRRKHTNVLQHIQGHFKKLLPADDRRELAALIADYHQGIVPLVVPVTLIRHHLGRHDLPYLAEQSYLEPHPKELMLRNHV